MIASSSQVSGGNVFKDPTDETYSKITIDMLVSYYKASRDGSISQCSTEAKTAFEKVDVKAKGTLVPVELTKRIVELKGLSGVTFGKYEKIEGDETARSISREKNAKLSVETFKKVCEILHSDIDDKTQSPFDPSTWGISSTDGDRFIQCEVNINDYISNDKNVKLSFRATTAILSEGRLDEEIFDGIGFTEKQRTAIRIVQPLIGAINATEASYSQSISYVSKTIPEQREKDIKFVQNLRKVLENAPYQIYNLNLSNIKPKYLLTYKVLAQKEGINASATKIAAKTSVIAAQRAALSSLEKSEQKFKIEDFRTF